MLPGRRHLQPLWATCSRTLVLTVLLGGLYRGSFPFQVVCTREDVYQSFKLLGFLDVKNVPCARESVLYGSLGSLVVGLGHFLATSRVRRSCDFAVGGFICTMLGYWFYCRYNLAQQKIRQRMLKEGMRNKMLFEGSSFDPEKKQTGNERSNS
ncbi:cytochrome c oxidase assembly protein COX20, mitochondrial [Meleagris gallopavo]|uniref:Cytochrome c oxidase assembly protein COX20, mitochondrial n=1 Tax=Meleagris gallopavo TaxID=9103 RepID=G1NG03_MELGA|nr:cytochrome c oxidase assembly protein COX20, mitochondrial [Meleagris gallopavo]